MEVNSTIVNLNVINSEEANLVQDVKHIFVSKDKICIKHCDKQPNKLTSTGMYILHVYNHNLSLNV